MDLQSTRPRSILKLISKILAWTVAIITLGFVLLIGGFLILLNLPPSRSDIQRLMEQSNVEVSIIGNLKDTHHAWIKASEHEHGLPSPGGTCARFSVSSAELVRLEKEGKIVETEYDEQCWSGGGQGLLQRVCGPLVNKGDILKLVASRCQGPTDTNIWINAAKKEAFFQASSFD
jgi:hypothetical protein